MNTNNFHNIKATIEDNNFFSYGSISDTTDDLIQSEEIIESPPKDSIINEERKSFKEQHDSFFNSLRFAYISHHKLLFEDTRKYKNDNNNNDDEKNYDNINQNFINDKIKDPKLEKSFLKQLVIDTNIHYYTEHIKKENLLKLSFAFVLTEIFLKRLLIIKSYFFLSTKNHRRLKINKTPNLFKIFLRADTIRKKVFINIFYKWKKLTDNIFVLHKLIENIKKIELTERGNEIMKTIKELIKDIRISDEITIQPKINCNLTTKNIPISPPMEQPNNIFLKSLPSNTQKNIPIPPVLPLQNILAVPGCPIPPLPNLHLPISKEINKHNIFTNLPSKNLNIRRFQWDKIEKKLISLSFWSKFQCDEKDFKLINYDKILETFTESKKAKQIDAKNTNNQIIKSQVINTILDNKRIMQISITLSKINFSISDIAIIIESYDAKNQLNFEILTKLLLIYPKKEEQNLLLTRASEISKCGNEEQFCFKLMSIPNCFSILSFLLFRNQISQNYQDYLTKIIILTESSISIKESNAFKKILFILLRIGNYLNYGNNKGNAYGFKISSLKLIDSIKSFKKKKNNLIDYLVEIIRENKNYELLTFYEEFKYITESLEIEQCDIETFLKEIEKELNKLTAEKSKENNQQYHSFIEKINNFALEKYRVLKDRHDKMKEEITKLAETFGESPITFKFLEFCKIIHDFIKKFKLSDYQKSQEEAKRTKIDIKHSKNPKAKCAEEFKKIQEISTRKTIAKKLNKEGIKIKNILQNDSLPESNDNIKQIRVTKYKLIDYCERQSNKISQKILNTISPSANKKGFGVERFPMN